MDMRRIVKKPSDTALPDFRRLENQEKMAEKNLNKFKWKEEQEQSSRAH